MKHFLVYLISATLIFWACQKETLHTSEKNNDQACNTAVAKTLNPFFEDVEAGVKTSYTTANVTLSTGSWTFNDALIGNSTSDKKNGLKSARIRNSGKLTLLADKTSGAGTITVKHAAYGTDAATTWQLWYSINSGSTWTQAGTTVTSVAGALQTATFNLNVSGNIRLEIRKTDGSASRTNIDDISVSDYSTTPPPVTNQKKFLFDAKHQQTAGNADWVIDQDNSTPLQFPTPALSTVTATTAESYWTGGISSWGIALVKLGHLVETITTSGSITYGNSSNPQDLANYHVFVVDEPNTYFTAAEKTAILQFVQNGGGLFIIGNHNGSDRNNDGVDAPAVWNNLMSSNTIQTNPFGFSFDLFNLSGTTTNVAATTVSPVMGGSQGTVTSIQYNSGTSMTMNPTVNPNVKGLVWKSSVTKNNNNVFCLQSTFGTGRVVAIGDSSPMDDGTGNPSDILYAAWNSYSHKNFMMNASLWLAQLQ